MMTQFLTASFKPLSQTQKIALLCVCLSGFGLGSCAALPKAKNEPAPQVSSNVARFGSALEASLAAQIANPEAAEAQSNEPTTDAARAVLANQNYRKGTTKPLVIEQTSLSKSSGKSGGGGS